MEGSNGKILAELTELEQNGLKRMRALNKQFLVKNKGSDAVRDFMRKAGADEALMLAYLRGRKYRPEHAWETLKRKAEVRFDEYPEVFVDEVPQCLTYFLSRGIFGLLKNRDQDGRRIIVFEASKWETDKFPMLEVTKAAIFIIERLLKDEDAINNGVIYVQNCEGMGMHHAKEYTLPAMLRLLHVLWYANPLKVKGVYYVNVPYYLYFIYGIIKPFFSKKLKQRFIVSSTSKKFDAVYETVNPEILPKFLGGAIDESEAFEDVSYLIPNNSDLQNDIYSLKITEAVKLV